MSRDSPLIFESPMDAKRAQLFVSRSRSGQRPAVGDERAESVRGKATPHCAENDRIEESDISVIKPFEYKGEF